MYSRYNSGRGEEIRGRFLTERSNSFFTDFNLYKDELFLVSYFGAGFYRIKCRSNGKIEPIYLCGIPELFRLASSNNLAYDMVYDVCVYE